MLLTNIRIRFFMKFYKYHGLGNDYIVIDPSGTDMPLEKITRAGTIRRICHRQFGLGSDGILLGPLKDATNDFEVRIFNPDGSEAEKSGNGLRIFARYLYEQGISGNSTFSMVTKGGKVNARVSDKGKTISVEMGTVSFTSTLIPVSGPKREVINEALVIDGQNLIICAATIGNPHCVIIQPEISPDQTRKLGPLIENHNIFPNRTNVQFGRIIDRTNMAIEIWERGAGYTLASGSSASAAAAVAFRLGLCDTDITVHMPGGNLEINLDEKFNVRMTGTVVRVADGRIHDEIFDQPAVAGNL
jgi:diaminopimelate epimerase